MRRFSIFLMLVMRLAACAVPGTPTSIPVQAGQSASDTPVSYGAFESSLLVTEWKGASKNIILYPLDPSRGTALPGYEPISLGFTFSHAFSPDRHTLAVMSFANDNAIDGSLLLIDIATWKTRRFEIGLSGWVNSMMFSPDGTRLAIAHGNTMYRLTMVDLKEGSISAQREMDFLIARFKFVENGRALMVYSPTTDPDNYWVAASPRVSLIDASTLKPIWSSELEGVRDGVFPRDETVTQANFYEPGNAFYMSPGLTFAPDRDALYIVHADSEHLTTVDFEKQSVKTVGISNKLSLFERFLSLTSGVAHAKVGDGIIRQAAISPDGQFLYVVGVNNSTSQDQNGNWQMQQSPLGLEILRVSDGSRVDHIETETTELSLSSDGRFLYLRNWGNYQNQIPWTEIYDTSTWQLINRKAALSGSPAFLIKGESLLVSTYSTAETVHHMSVLERDGSHVLADWTDTSYIWWLTAH